MVCVIPTPFESMHLRSYRILQMSLHGGPQIFLKFCTQSYISKANLPWKFQLPDRHGCRDMNTLRFETKPHFAKSQKRKNAITSEVFIENLQIFFTPLFGEIAKIRIFKNFWNYIFLIAQDVYFNIVTNLSWQIWTKTINLHLYHRPIFRAFRIIFLHNKLCVLIKTYLIKQICFLNI